MSTNINKALQSFTYVLAEHKEGGLDFNLLIDNVYPNGQRILISPLLKSRSFEATQLSPGNGLILLGNSIPEEVVGEHLTIATERFDYGMILVPEFRTILAYTEDFYRRAQASIAGIPTDNPVTPRDWVMLILRLNAYTIFMKSWSMLGIKDGKGKGLSQTELKFLNDSYVPIYIRIDSDRLQSPNQFESYIAKSIHKAAVFVDNLILSEVSLVPDAYVYFQGYRCYRSEATTSRECYTPKIDLIEKGFPTLPEFYQHLIKRVQELPEEELNEVYNQVSIVWGLEADEEENE